MGRDAPETSSALISYHRHQQPYVATNGYGYVANCSSLAVIVSDYGYRTRTVHPPLSICWYDEYEYSYS
eukprot:scaffold260403_cov20-Prasinocladus_malaysianus.AAC.1